MKKEIREIRKIEVKVADNLYSFSKDYYEYFTSYALNYWFPNCCSSSIDSCDLLQGFVRLPRGAFISKASMFKSLSSESFPSGVEAELVIKVISIFSQNDILSKRLIELGETFQLYCHGEKYRRFILKQEGVRFAVRLMITLLLAGLIAGIVAAGIIFVAPAVAAAAHAVIGAIVIASILVVGLLGICLVFSLPFSFHKFFTFCDALVRAIPSQETVKKKLETLSGQSIFFKPEPKNPENDNIYSEEQVSLSST